MPGDRRLGGFDPGSPRTRRKVILFAYACDPFAGSEPGIGWNLAKQLAAHHDVWVLTRTNNQPAIDRELSVSPVEGLTLLYHELPAWLRWWKRGGRGVNLYYYLWQLTAIFAARHWHQTIRFDASHHLTFGRYWSPSGAAYLGLPFLWGPVGGADGVPDGFWGGLSRRSQQTERLRVIVQAIAELDPLVRLTARNSSLALGTTDLTSKKLSALGARNVRQLQVVSLSLEEANRLFALRQRTSRTSPHLNLVSVGRLEGWKGTHLVLRALPHVKVSSIRYTIIGTGPELARLTELTNELGIADRVNFTGAMPREDALTCISESDVLIQPSLHDSGGWVTLEAMAAGLPVIALNLAGPATQVTNETGILIDATSEEQTIASLATAIEELASDPRRRHDLGQAGYTRVLDEFTWESRARSIAAMIDELMNETPN